MAERRSVSIRQASANGIAEGRNAISRSLSASRSRQTWSIIGCLGLAQESTRSGRGSASRLSVRSQTSCTPGEERAMRLVVGDLPAPGGVAARKRHGGGDGGAVEEQPVDPRLPVGGERHDSALHEMLDRGVVDDRGAGEALPAARLQHQEILQRGLDAARIPRGGEGQRRDVLEPPALAAQLLSLVAGDRALEISFALCAGREQRAFMAAESCASAALPRQHRIERLGEGALLGNERQQEPRRA